MQSLQVAAHSGVIELSWGKRVLGVALATPRAERARMNVVFLVAGSAQRPGSGQLAFVFVAHVTGNPVVSTFEGEITDVMKCTDLFPAASAVATRAVGSKSPFVNVGLGMTAKALSGCWFESQGRMAVLT